MTLYDKFHERLWRLGTRLGKHRPDRIGPFATQSFTDSERNASDLHRLFYGNNGPQVHKWKHYLSVYANHLDRFRNRPVKILEIGVFKGGSLRLWRQYFGALAIIFGIDIDPHCKLFDGTDDEVRIGSQADTDFLKQVVDEMTGIDIVIDDGSHIASHQIKSFEFLFPKLATDGVYICEDLHTSYWPGEYEGGYRRSSTFIEMAKRLIDDIHSDFHSRQANPIAADIQSLHFYNSMVVIEKARREPPAHIQIG